MQAIFKLLFFSTFILVTPLSAFAYLDAGTGSIVLQAVMGIALAGMFVIKTYWRKLQCFISGLFRKSSNSDGVDAGNGVK